MCRMNDIVSLAIFTYFFSLFGFIRTVLMVFYFINILFKRKNVLKLIQESNKISIINSFSFSFKLNGKKVPSKNIS